MQCTDCQRFWMSANYGKTVVQSMRLSYLNSNWIICLVSFITSQKLCSSQLGMLMVVLTKELGQRLLLPFLSAGYPTLLRMFNLSQQRNSSKSIFLLLQASYISAGSFETALALSSISVISSAVQFVRNSAPLCEMATMAVERGLKTWKVKEGRWQQSLGWQLRQRIRGSFWLILQQNYKNCMEVWMLKLSRQQQSRRLAELQSCRSLALAGTPALSTAVSTPYFISQTQTPCSCTSDRGKTALPQTTRLQRFSKAILQLRSGGSGRQGLLNSRLRRRSSGWRQWLPNHPSLLQRRLKLFYRMRKHLLNFLQNSRSYFERLFQKHCSRYFLGRGFSRLSIQLLSFMQICRKMLRLAQGDMWQVRVKGRTTWKQRFEGISLGSRRQLSETFPLLQIMFSSYSFTSLNSMKCYIFAKSTPLKLCQYILAADWKMVRLRWVQGYPTSILSRKIIILRRSSSFLQWQLMNSWQICLEIQPRSPLQLFSRQKSLIYSASSLNYAELHSWHTIFCHASVQANTLCLF